MEFPEWLSPEPSDTGESGFSTDMCDCRRVDMLSLLKVESLLLESMVSGFLVRAACGAWVFRCSDTVDMVWNHSRQSQDKAFVSKNRCRVLCRLPEMETEKDGEKDSGGVGILG